MFKVTTGLIGGWFVFGLILGLGTLNETFFYLGAVFLLVSLVTMYVDLRDLDGRLWDTRPILWVIGAALLYIVVAPLYIYKRQEVG